MSIFLGSCLSYLAAFLNFIPIPNHCKTVLSYIIKCEKPWQRTQTPNVTTQPMQSSDAALWYYLCYQNKHGFANRIISPKGSINIYRTQKSKTPPVNNPHSMCYRILRSQIPSWIPVSTIYHSGFSVDEKGHIWGYHCIRMKSSITSTLSEGARPLPKDCL